MSKVLYVLRHAQSVSKQGEQLDIDRPLTVEGAAQANRLGIKLKQLGFTADRVLSSSALRARETLALVNRSVGISEQKISFRDELYEALMTQCLGQVQETVDDDRIILLVGHNPWISMLASTLTGKSIELTPCEFLGIEFDITRWSNLPQPGKEILRVKPE